MKLDMIEFKGRRADMIIVMAAIIHNTQGEILICRRGEGGNCSGLWEFPGGKQEPGETPEECIHRECQEELEINIALSGIFANTLFRYPDKEIEFTFFNASITGGTPKPIVHSELEWVMPDQLDKYPFCPADIEIVKKLMEDFI